MARKLQDPLANIAALMTDNDILFNSGDDSTTYSFQLHPVYSFNFPEAGSTLIPRLIIPILGIPSLSSYWKLGEQRPQSGDTTWGMGDMVTRFFFAPSRDGFGNSVSSLRYLSRPELMRFSMDPAGGQGQPPFSPVPLLKTSRLPAFWGS